jgi:hypothetical protein
MHKELLSHTPLLALPIFALVLFLAVFAAQVARAFTRPSSELARDESLPLKEDEHDDA